MRPRLRRGRGQALTALAAVLASTLLVVAVAWAATLHVTVYGQSSVGLAWLACPPSGVCLAEGEIHHSSHTLALAPVSRAGKQGKEVAINTATGPLGVACPAANFCLALAYDSSNTRLLVAVPVRGGVAQPPVVLPRSARSVSCGAGCSVSHSNGVFDVFHVVYRQIARDYVLSAGRGQCVSASLCYVLSSGTQGPVDITTVSHSRIVRTSSQAANVIPLDMACQNATYCVVIGDAGFGINSPGVLATVTDGQVGQVQRVPGSVVYETVSCSPTICFAFFHGKSSRPQSLMIPIINGVVGTAVITKIAMNTAVCSGNTCLGLGVTLDRGFESRIIKFTYSSG